MKELNLKAKRDNKIMGLLKVNQLFHNIANTDKGDLTLRIGLGGTGADYRFVLDAVPVSAENNKILMDLFKEVVVAK